MELGKQALDFLRLRSALTSSPDRSEALLCSYAIARANGFCECCGRPAQTRLQAVTNPQLVQSPTRPATLPMGANAWACCPECLRNVVPQPPPGVVALERGIDADRFLCVTAAVMVRWAAQGEVQVLLAQRGGSGAFASKWEFPGGKVKQGESLAQCLAREIREELDVDIVEPIPYYMVDHTYPEFHIRLFALGTSIASGRINLTEHENVVWIRPGEPTQESRNLSGADVAIWWELVRRPVRPRGVVPYTL